MRSVAKEEKSEGASELYYPHHQCFGDPVREWATVSGVSPWNTQMNN
jgi:hypothetical protein